MTTPHTRQRAQDRRGFSLIEVLIALMMLAIVVTSLAGLTGTMARRARRVSGSAFQTGLLTKEVDRAVAVPIESLAVKLGQTTVDTPVTTPFPYARAISISGRADSLTVRIAIRPLLATQRADSVTQSVLRTR
jgi:prepilin-type N-terminal cleavage/methylation domain-containing protein